MQIGIDSFAAVISDPKTGEMLSPGDYQVKLSGVLDSGADEFIDNYSFRVIE